MQPNLVMQPGPWQWEYTRWLGQHCLQSAMEISCDQFTYAILQQAFQAVKDYMNNEKCLLWAKKLQYKDFGPKRIPQTDAK